MIQCPFDLRYDRQMIKTYNFFLVFFSFFYLQTSYSQVNADSIKEQHKRNSIALCHDNEISPCPEPKTDIYQINSPEIQQCYEKKKAECRSVNMGTDHSIGKRDQYHNEQGLLVCDITVAVRCK